MPSKSSIALKAAKVTVVAVAGFLYFITSLFINLLQALNYLFFGKLYNCQDFRRKVNSYLQDIILSQVTIISEWWCGARYRLFFADQETADSFGREHSLVIGNHRYQIDLMLYWLFGEMTNTMGAGKAFTKVELKRMPIFGWSFFFGEFIFLQRNWKEDEKRIGPAIDQLVAHPFPITLLLLPEGTRFTSEKYQAAMKFVEERKIPINLKYHLLPRVKGFAATLGHLQKNHANNFGVYHCQLIARTKPPGEETFMPTLKSLIRGKPFNVDCYIEKIDTSRLPGAEATEAEHSAFLYIVFEKMDKLMDQHLKEDSFPKTAIMKVKRPSIFKALRFVLLNFVFSASLVYLLVYQAIVTHSFYLRLVIYSVIITVTGGLFLIYKRLQYSKYGGTGKKKE